MQTMSATFNVNRPVEDVFSYLASFENRMEYEEGLIECKQTSEGPFGLGSEVRKEMGMRMESTYRISAFEPNKLFQFEATSGPMVLEGRFAFEPQESGTQVSIAFDGRMKGLMRLFEPMMVGKFRGQMARTTAKIKENLESKS